MGFIKIVLCFVAMSFGLSALAIDTNQKLPHDFVKLLSLNTKKKKPLSEYEIEIQKMEALKKQYKDVTKNETIITSLEYLKDTIGEFSYKAIMGNNLTDKSMKIEFKNLATIGEAYAGFDALGWKKSGKLNIYINEKHQDAPPEALSALLAHEALHQDEFDSLNEEAYAWTLEAAVWFELTENNSKLVNISHPLVNRENTLKQLFVKGNYTDKYIKKAVFTNPGYSRLPSRSPGFEDDNL